jgi:hypothetical protein
VRSPRAIVLLFLCVSRAVGQGPDTAAPAEPPGIQDNSFLVEEAYNQDPGVVQHIQQFFRDSRSGSWVYSFTQEWPAPGLDHQLSYTLTAARAVHERGHDSGWGDAQLNYRYQLVGDGQAQVAVAPRASLLLPAGSYRRELGLGGVGLQTQIPVSVVLSRQFVVHGNAGVTWVPHARDAAGDRAPIVAPNLGASAVWLASPFWNLLCETVWSRNEAVAGPGRVEKHELVLVNPGLRAAWNFRSGLQIVGGVSAPLGIGPSHGSRSILLYLSFEHPFRTVSKE